MNTPQFDWVKNRMPREPQPVPPIYAPEVAADAIVWALDHRRRELSVGGPTAAAIWSDKVASGLLEGCQSLRMLMARSAEILPEHGPEIGVVR